MCPGVFQQVPSQRGQMGTEGSRGSLLSSFCCTVPSDGSTPSLRGYHLRSCPGGVSSRQSSWTSLAGLGAYSSVLISGFILLSPHWTAPHWPPFTSPQSLRAAVLAVPSAWNILPKASGSSAFRSELSLPREGVSERTCSYRLISNPSSSILRSNTV